MLPLRSYMAPSIGPIRLSNSKRLYALIRAGNLYLTVQDALALAIENNLNLEIARYGPLLADSALQRAKAGGPYRGVPSASAQVSSVTPGVGVNGSTLSAGLSGGGGGGGGNGGANTTIEQVGQMEPNFDPILQSTETFSHLTEPQTNQVVSQTNALVQGVHTYNTVLNQGLITGGQFRYIDYEQYLKENAPSDYLNPVTAPYMGLWLRQPLLQGFGIALNNRDIRIARINTFASRQAFRSEMLNLAGSVINLYWNYASAYEELRLRQRALAITEKFRDDTKYEISIGAIAGVELPRAEAEVASRRQDLNIAQGNLRQQAVLLKEAISHTEDPALESAGIVPLDQVEVPEELDLPPVRQLVGTAVAQRPDVQIAKLKDETDAINLLGTTNPLLPSLTATVQTYNRAVTGTPQLSGGTANPYFVGGYGSALGQIFRRNFPNETANVLFSIPFENRLAQGDYGIDQLQYRQSQVEAQRDRNRVLVDVSSQAAALRQARARYDVAREERVLDEQLLAAERRKSYGPETFNYIMADQRALIAAQLLEMNAMAAYAHARAALDQVLGTTLERYHISLEEGLRGRVERQSTPPVGAGGR